MRIERRTEIVFREEEVIALLDVYEFALNEGYKLDIPEKEVLQELLEEDFVKANSMYLPLVFKACDK